MAIAVDQIHGLKPFTRRERCRLQSCSHLENNTPEFKRTNHAYSVKQAIKIANFHKSSSTPCLSLATTVEEELGRTPRIEIFGGRGVPRVRALVVETAIAVASGVEPLPVSSGLGGAYILGSRNGDKIAVAKPMDEEPLAFNNPKGFGGLMLGQPGLKRSVRVGETGIRELAAYLLDHGGFAGVPPTALVKISHVSFHFNNADLSTTCKIASLQRFVDHHYDAGELGPSGFSVASVHRIGIFDVRLLNLDRHAGNILVRKNVREQYAIGTVELVPIDHGLCLPEWLDDPYFEWMHWPQASVPFSETEAEYISNLDPFKDAETLRKEVPFIRESSIRVLVICTIFLKRAAAAGLCLADIGKMMTREFHGEANMSMLEHLCAKTKAAVNDIFNSDDHKMQRKQAIEEACDKYKFGVENNINISGVSDLSQLIKGPLNVVKPPKIPRFPSVASLSGIHDAEISSLHEDKAKNCCDDIGNDFDKKIDKRNKSNEGDSHKMVRSMSSTEKNYKYGSEGIFFGDMSENEWELFLVRFEELLPNVFEGAKCLETRHRLGASCEF